MRAGRRTCVACLHASPPACTNWCCAPAPRPFCLQAWATANMRAAMKHEAAYPRACLAQRRQVAQMLPGGMGESVLGPQPFITCVMAQPNRAVPLPNARCSGCGRGGDELKRCGRCHETLYCSRTCQVRWECSRGGSQEMAGEASAGMPLLSSELCLPVFLPPSAQRAHWTAGHKTECQPKAAG